MAITLSHGGDTIFSSKSRSDEVMVGTKDGLAFSENETATGGPRPTGRCPTSTYTPSSSKPESGAIIVGATHDTVYVSEDGGQTWERRDDGITQHGRFTVLAAKTRQW